MKKTLAVKLFALLMAALMVFAGCSSEKITTSEEENELFKDISSGSSEVSLLEKAISAFEKKNEQLSNFDYDNMAVDAEIEIKLGKAFGEFVDMFSGTSSSDVIDALGFESAKISADFDRNGDEYSLTAGAYINDEFVVDADVMFDYAGEMLYLAIPELAEGSLGVDASDVVESIKDEFGDFAGLYQNQLDAQQKLIEGLEEHISEDELVDILEDYAETGMAELDEPEVEDTEISVDGIEQKVEAYTYKVTSNDAQNLCKAVLEKLYDDEDIKEKFLAVYPLVFEYLDVASAGEFSYYAESDAEEVYAEFLSEIEYLLDELEEETEDDSVVDITCYFADDAFAGFSVIPEDLDGSFDVYCVRNSNDVAFSFEFDDGYDTTSFKVVGNDKDGMYNGVITVSPAYGESATIRIEDFDLNKFAEGCISCTVAVYAEDMPDVMSEMPEGFAVKLKYDSDYLTYFNFCVVLENNGNAIIDADVNLGISDDADNISVPSTYVDVEDEAAVSSWANSLLANVNTIIENLENAGISQDAIGMLVNNLVY